MELTSNQIFLVARSAMVDSDMVTKFLLVANYFDTGVDGGARD